MHPLIQETSLMSYYLALILTVKLQPLLTAAEGIMFPRITALLCVQPVSSGKNAISSVLPLTLFTISRRAIIQHDNHVITGVSLCPYPSQPLANCVCVCLLPRLHPGLHHAICIPGGEEDGAQAGFAGVRPPVHPGEQRRGVL